MIEDSDLYSPVGRWLYLGELVDLLFELVGFSSTTGVRYCKTTTPVNVVIKNKVSPCGWLVVGSLFTRGNKVSEAHPMVKIQPAEKALHRRNTARLSNAAVGMGAGLTALDS